MAGLEHTDREYEHELLQLREQLLVMGSHVESIIGDSIHALLERDTKLAERTILADKIVDRMEVELDGFTFEPVDGSFFETLFVIEFAKIMVFCTVFEHGKDNASQFVCSGFDS